MDIEELGFGPPESGWTDMESKPFKPDVYDLAFTFVMFVLAYLFSRWVFFSWYGWGVLAFTGVYLLVVSAYLVKKGAAVTPEAVFWFAVTLVTGASFALWSAPGLYGIRPLFLFCSAAYFTLTASKCQILGKTSNYLLLDGINAVFVIPFRNFINQYVSFKLLRRGEKRSGRRGHIVLGVAIVLVLFFWLVPMLESADSGGFSKIAGAVRSALAFWNYVDSEFLLCAFFSLPMGLYIYGLVSGCAHRRHTDAFKPEKVESNVDSLRVLQPATILIALGGLCALYVLFIACQIPYFFSAFTGSRPDGFLNYSEYARRGFFELCRIAAINLAVITAGNIVSKRHRRDFRALRAINVALSLITLLLIATAISKMALYIDAYGLSILRLLPCVFMVFLGVVFIALIALQWKQFSIVRAALIAGSVIMCALCLSNPDAIVARYNADRYLAGTLDTCDIEIFRRAGAAGVIPAIEVLHSTNDEALRQQIEEYLSWQSYYTGHEVSFEVYRAREAISAEQTPQ